MRTSIGAGVTLSLERPSGRTVRAARGTDAWRAGVLRLLAEGFSDDAMAKRLSLSHRAVRSRLQRVHEKTGLSGRAVVVFAKDHAACCGGGSGAA